MKKHEKALVTNFNEQNELFNDAQMLIDIFRARFLFSVLLHKSDQVKKYKTKIVILIDKLLSKYDRVLPHHQDIIKRLTSLKEAIENNFKTAMAKFKEPISASACTASIEDFIKLDTFYRTIWILESSSQKLNTSVEVLIKNAKLINEQLKNLGALMVLPVFLSTYLHGMIGLLTEYKKNPAVSLRKDAVSALIEVSTTVIGIFRKTSAQVTIPLLEVLLCEGIFKQIVVDLTKQLAYLSKPQHPLSKELQPVETMSQDFKRLAVADLTAAQSAEPRLPARQEAAQDVPKAQVQDPANAQTRKEEKEALKKDLEAKTSVTLEGLQNVNKEAIAIEAKKHQRELAKLRAKNVSELNTKQAELSVEHQKKLEALRKTHEEKLAAQSTQHQIKLQKIITGHQAELGKQSSEFQTELNDRTAQHQERVQQLNADHHATMAQQVSQHQSDLKTQREEHLIALSLQISEHEAALLAQEAHHQANLDQLGREHHLELLSLKDRRQVELARLREQQLEAFRALERRLQLQRKEVQRKYTEESRAIALKQQEEVQLMEPMLRSIHQLIPIAHIDIPSRIGLLTALGREKHEFYIVGGWVRNRLMGLPVGHNEDIDVLVNCMPDELPDELKAKCWQNPNQPKHFKLGTIDIWCEKWEDLKEVLRRKDFTLNTFISTAQGEVYDLLGAQQDLSNPCLKVLGNSNARFIEDPSLMMRMIRFSSQLQKEIHQTDIEIIKVNAGRLRCLPIGIYLKNIQKLFLGQFARKNFSTVLRHGLLSQLFPTLPSQLPLFGQFWEDKLNDFSSHADRYSYYHVLALFLLMPFTLKNQTLDSCLEAFFERYEGKINLAEKETIKKNIQCLILEPSGLYEQFKNSYLPPMPAINTLLFSSPPTSAQLKPASQIDPNSITLAKRK